MKYALVNPHWDFKGSIYFGCPEPHYPLELLFAQQQLRAAGHEAEVIDAHLNQSTQEAVIKELKAFEPDFLAMTTAPTYLFWRCPPPELRVPMGWFRALRDTAKITVAIGPHSSATPRTTLRKLGCDVAFRGEPDEALAQLASRSWSEIDGCCWRDEHGTHLSSTRAVVDMHKLPALSFDGYNVEAHSHRHHVFHGSGRGAELEFARGCPWSCSFCNKTLFRDKYRERAVEAVLAEVDQLIARGVDYVYFIDEIFGVGRNVRILLTELAKRPIKIGLQTRIDLWDEETLELLGAAHCISVECGVESITEEGRDELNKGCRLSTDRISELLIFARQRIPWVQANLILTDHDDRHDIRRWQEHLRNHRVWVSDPVPMFPFPGTPDFVRVFGPPTDDAWERALEYYTSTFRSKGYSDIQDPQPASLEDLECTF
jgi:B12-binding domain/radical SAM domain protein of rhizo-twelve system